MEQKQDTAWVDGVIHTIEAMMQPLYTLFQDDRTDSSYDLAMAILHEEETENETLYTELEDEIPTPVETQVAG